MARQLKRAAQKKTASIRSGRTGVRAVTPQPVDWSAKLRTSMSVPTHDDPGLPQYMAANVDAIRAALSGLGPDVPAGTRPAAGLMGMGACMAVNISAAHIPAVCKASRDGEPRPYKNGYDLGRYHVGDSAPDRAVKLREIVDAALPLSTGSSPKDIYFGAMELNGTGVYFYGDVCLILRDIRPETIVLDRNSYELVRAPLRTEIEDGHPRKTWPKRRADAAQQLAGTWGLERDSIAAIKVISALGFRARRFTTGQISDAIRDDEDYIEILKHGSFGTDHIAEARLSAADAACESSIEDRRSSGPAPALEALLWRDRRRIAERELRARGVAVRVVTTAGRTKG